jgi:hypothetical protein
MAYNAMKLRQLCERVYNNKMIKDEANNIDDEKDIREYAQKVFGDGSVTPDPSLLHQFNNLVVQQADVIVKVQLKTMLSLFSNFKPANRGDVVKIEYPQTLMKTKVIWSANGSGVDLVRIAPSQAYDIAVPKTFSAGVYYEPLDMATDAVANFRKAVNDVAEAKIRLYYQVLNDIMQAAIASGKIPAKNVAVGTDLTLADYNKVATTLQRYGGKPIFVADMLLIDYFSKQQVLNDDFYSKILTESFKTELLEQLVPTKIGRTTAVNLFNPFIDRTNSVVDLPINIGYMFASAGSVKPFSIVEFGGLRQLTEQDPEDERIKIKIVQDADVRLLAGWLFGYIKEDGNGVAL